MDDHFEALKQVWIWQISIIAGIVCYLQEASTSTEMISLRMGAFRFAVRVSVAIFTGMMAYTFSVATGIKNEALLFFIVGITAWQGTLGLKVLGDISGKILGALSGIFTPGKSVDQDSEK